MPPRAMRGPMRYRRSSKRPTMGSLRSRSTVRSTAWSSGAAAGWGRIRRVHGTDHGSPAPHRQPRGVACAPSPGPDSGRRLAPLEALVDGADVAHVALRLLVEAVLAERAQALVVRRHLVAPGPGLVVEHVE